MKARSSRPHRRMNPEITPEESNGEQHPRSPQGYLEDGEDRIATNSQNTRGNVGWEGFCKHSFRNNRCLLLAIDV